MTLQKLYAVCAFYPPTIGQVDDAVELAQYGFANMLTHEYGTGELHFLVTSCFAYRPRKPALPPEMLKLIEEGDLIAGDLFTRILG